MTKEEHEKVIQGLEDKHKEAVESLENQVKAKDEKIGELEGKISELEGALNKDEAPKGKKKSKYLGLCTTISHNGKKIKEGTPKEEIPKDLQEKFSKYIRVIEK